MAKPMRIGRAVGVGATTGGGLGSVAGLAIGLAVYPPTAAFAVIELGIPAAAAGGVIGALASLLAAATRHHRQHG